MQYKNCSGDTYEVRWNVRDANPATPVGTRSRLSILTVSSRLKAASGCSQAMLLRPPQPCARCLKTGRIDDRHKGRKRRTDFDEAIAIKQIEIKT